MEQPSFARATTLSGNTESNLPCALSARTHHRFSIHTLPIDLLLQLMQSLDPVSQRCLGLTCTTLELIFHMVYPRDPITGLFNAKRFQFGLNLQASVDGQHLLNWGFDDWYLTGCRDIEWGKDLGTLLYNEVTLWGDLVSCEGCRIYKPQEAFDHFEFERNFLSKAKVQRQVHTLEPEDIAWYKSHCKRCRVRILLVFLDSRVEMLDEQELGLHTRTSLGVLYKTPRTEFERKQEMEAARGLGPEEYHAAECGYETWSQIFEKLKI